MIQQRMHDHSRSNNSRSNNSRHDSSQHDIRHGEPLYSCIVPVECLTQRQDEELTTFGRCETEAIDQAKALLHSTYGCTDEQIDQVMQQAVIEPLSPWCGVGRDRS